MKKQRPIFFCLDCGGTRLKIEGHWFPNAKSETGEIEKIHDNYVCLDCGRTKARFGTKQDLKAAKT